MGISGLLPALSPVTKAIHVKDYAGKRVAIDGYSWLHKGAYSCSQELVLGRATQGYINYFINRIKMLQSYKVIPVVVFDGGPLPNKKGKEQERLQHREEYKNKAIAYLNEGNKAQAQVCFQKAVDITPRMAYLLIKELRRYNIEYLVAPYEADAQLTYLSITGQVDAIITEDSDLVAYGASHLILKMDKDGYAQEIKTEDLGSCKKDGYDFIDFTQTMLRQMCILSGCDYLPSLPGMGLKTSFKLLKQHRDIEKVFRYLKREKPGYTKEYEQLFYRADFTFKHQRVYDPVTRSLTTLLPLDKDYPEEEIDFIGPLIDNETAERIAKGIIDPETLVEFDPNDKIPEITFNPQPKRSLSSFSFNTEFKNTGVNYSNQDPMILNGGKLIKKSGTLNHQFTFKSNQITSYFNKSETIIEEQEELFQENQIFYDNQENNQFQYQNKKQHYQQQKFVNSKNSKEKDDFILDSDDEQRQEEKDEEYIVNSNSNSSSGNSSGSNVDQKDEVKSSSFDVSTKKKTLVTSKFFTTVPESDDEDEEVYGSGINNINGREDSDPTTQPFVEDSDDSFDYKISNQNNFINNLNSDKSTLIGSKDRISMSFFDQFQFNGKKKESFVMNQATPKKSLSYPSLSVDNQDQFNSGGSNNSSLSNSSNGSSQNDNNNSNSNIHKNSFKSFKRKSSSQTLAYPNSPATTTSATTSTTEHSSYLLKKQKYHINNSTTISSPSSFFNNKNNNVSSPIPSLDLSQNINDQSFITRKSHSFSSLNSDLIFNDDEDNFNINSNGNNDDDNNSSNSNGSSNNISNSNNNSNPTGTISTPKHINSFKNFTTPPATNYNNGNSYVNFTPPSNNNSNSNNNSFNYVNFTPPSNNNSNSSTPNNNQLTPTSTLNSPSSTKSSPLSSHEIFSKYFYSPVAGKPSNSFDNSTLSSFKERLSFRYQQSLNNNSNNINNQ